MTPCAIENLVKLEHGLLLDSIQLNGLLSSAYYTKKTRLLESHDTIILKAGIVVTQKVPDFPLLSILIYIV